MTISLLERIERHSLELRDDECWFTTYSPSTGIGYVQIGFGSRTDGTRATEYLHRIAYEAYYAEPIPPGLVVRHTCDTPSCWNPAHLVLGTHAENAHDMYSRGRARPGCGLTADGQPRPRDARGRFC